MEARLIDDKRPYGAKRVRLEDALKRQCDNPDGCWSDCSHGAGRGWESWDEFLGWVAIYDGPDGACVHYQAPMDADPTLVTVTLQGRELHVTLPPWVEADNFTADEGHLERFSR